MLTIKTNNTLRRTVRIIQINTQGYPTLGPPSLLSRYWREEYEGVQFNLSNNFLEFQFAGVGETRCCAGSRPVEADTTNGHLKPAATDMGL